MNDALDLIFRIVARNEIRRRGDWRAGNLRKRPEPGAETVDIDVSDSYPAEMTRNSAVPPIAAVR